MSQKKWLSSENTGKSFFGCHFGLLWRFKKIFLKKFIFGGLHPQKLKDGDRGAEIGHFQDILKTYTDLEAYWGISNDS